MSSPVIPEVQESNLNDHGIEENRQISATKTEHAAIVAAHYNNIDNKFETRNQSPIINLRNFNNWLKSTLISKYAGKIKETDHSLVALDICCGKGGDLMKWKMAYVAHLVCADIADVSVKQCIERYDQLKSRMRNLYTAEFITLDCASEWLRPHYKDPSTKFNLVSCQFALHYSFESFLKAKIMLNNISDCLKPGGYFIGTIPDANEIISRARKSDNGDEFGNKDYKIKLKFDPNDEIPLFGAEYDFGLQEVVNCPEFLVNFDLLTKLAAEVNLELDYKANFGDFFTENQSSGRINLEYCSERMLDNPNYEHYKKYINQNEEGRQKLKTISISEWEVATIYIAFAFKKK